MIKNPAYFIAGTDTHVGKTTSAVALLNLFNEAGLKTVGLKPVASDAIQTKDGLRNEDARALQKAANQKFAYETINPFVFKAPVSPNFAAEKVGQSLSLASLIATCKLPPQNDRLVTIVEGAGGWFVPLNAMETLADWVAYLHLPVILVVGIRLGCLNHTKLTLHAIQSMGCELAGWIGNILDPHMDMLDENLHFLHQTIHAPCLGIVPFDGQHELYLSISPLLTSTATNEALHLS